MRITLLGTGSDKLLADLSAAGIEYQHHRPEIGEIMNSGQWIEIAQASAPLAAVVAVIVAWIRARASRKIIITLPDNQIVHAEGMSAKDVERYLTKARNIMIVETRKPDQPKTGKTKGKKSK